ncbi:MAG: ABC transporter permease [Gemmatimonadaceae bacterium]|nr:ABC transporter permease [Gemmatimonadaceae bacterium]
MPRLPGLRRLFRHVDSVDRVQRDVDDEIAFHLDAVTAELVAGGLDEGAARREAERRFGPVDQHRSSLKSEGRERLTRARWRTALDELRSDLGYAVRGLVREPLFALGAIFTLAIGIAANSTMFSVIDRLLLRAPPHVRDTPEMSLVYFTRPEGSGRAFTRNNTSWPDFAALRDSSGAVKDAAAYFLAEGSLDQGPAARKVSLGLATGNFFNLLGASPALGRWFTPAEDDPAATEPAVVLADALWRGQFNADPAVLGRAVRLDGRMHTVVGVAPPGFHGPQSLRVDAWIPIRTAAGRTIGADFETSRNWFWIKVVAERRADVPLTMAAERATLVHQRANRESKQSDSLARVVFASMVPARGAGVERTPGIEQGGRAGFTPQGRIAAWLGGVAAVVLLIVCANLANLLLSRASRRRREIAVRLAMGVRRGRLVRQLLSETLLLSLASGSVGLLLAWWGSAFMRRTFLAEMAWDSAAIDARVVAFTLCACLVTVVMAGLAPALVASRQDLTTALKAGTRGGGHRRTTLQRALLVAQAALSVVLLVGAGLFVRSLRNVASVHLGYDASKVLVADVDLGPVFAGANRDSVDVEVDRFWAEALERVGHLPGVASAALGVTTPFASSWASDFKLPGRDSLPELRGEGPYVNSVSPAFLATLGTRVTRGRGFLPTDVKGAEPVGVINEEMATRLWPGQNPIGQCMKVGGDSVPCTTVVGVMENSFRDNLREETVPQYLVVLGQATWQQPTWRSLFVRTNGDPAVVAALVRERLQTQRPDLPYAHVRTLRSIIEPEIEPWQLGATMFGVFGGLALLVAAIGLYAVVAYDVSQRWHELGVRSALGARPGQLRGLIVGDGVRHAMVGLVIGGVVAWAFAPLASGMLYRVAPRDPVTYSIVAGVLLGAAAVACLLPARRAARVAPADVLRGD